ncbi:MAG: type II toxin-antitoxin system HigB family toxin [Thaumarchaeota archaeon]|nr:type II toxin-antitoxin system HigB family toxin [Nitrososphaerota archaeon]
MRIISKKRLREFWEKHPDAKDPLLAWYRITEKARWKSLADTKKDFSHADLVGVCTVFNIKGGTYRLITAIKYHSQTVYTLHVLTHAEYDKGRWKDDCAC